MSFITKRERVFNEYDLFELPARNEGKLKAYASCTDARAWSHFCSDKSEHLVEIIKRNNETRKTKYVPTEAIVNTLLANKHAEISRLKRKIEEFEQMLAVYDELELTCDQKCEIAKAHAAIKEANKDLNELWFDLDLSGFTGVDSEDFETGKSRGDEPSKFRQHDAGDESPTSKGDEWSFDKEPQKESKGNQAGDDTCICDASTNAVDPRIEQLQECIISRDAKINAMKNSMAVAENDVCEPYCIYAHIYTALEKIFGILCQNEKYKLYLSLMTAGKDTRCIDIKGKILYKLKVLEKFNLALISPCSQDYAVHTSHNSEQECACYRAEVTPRVEASFALTSAESQPPCLDSKRAQLVADIMENEEMKEILNKENKTDDDNNGNVNFCYNINQENVNRLKNLQKNYDALMTCYETLKHERDCLQIRCGKYEDLEKEFENLKSQLMEYNTLWNEKEHYRKRSLDLDALKEQYLVLCDETTSLETELKAENEINDVKAKTIEELRSDNISLEKRLNEAYITFEKEKNYAHCKLKESECTIMCQEQQIRSLSLQIDRLLEQDPEQLKQSEMSAIPVIDEMNSLREQIKNLRDAIFCTEEDKQQLQEEYENKLNFINDLKMELEDMRTNYEKAIQRNGYLEKYTVSFQDEIHELIEKNKALSQDVENKSNAIDNLINIINNKSLEVNKLMENMEYKNKEINDLNDKIHSIHDDYSKNIKALDTEKSHAMNTLQLAKQESHELLEKVKDYDEIVRKQDYLSSSYREQNEEFNRVKSLLIRTQQENENLQLDLNSRNRHNSILLQEIQRLQDMSNNADINISALQESLELTRKDSKVMEDKLRNFENISHQLKQLQESHEILIIENNKLQHELANKKLELGSTMNTIYLTKKKSEELEGKVQNNENLKEGLIKEKQLLLAELDEKNIAFGNLLESFNNLKIASSKEIEVLSKELDSLRKSYNELLSEKNVLQNDSDIKTKDINNLRNTLTSKVEENAELAQQLKLLEHKHKNVQSSMTMLQDEHHTAKSTIYTLRKYSDELIQRVKYYEMLESEYDQLKKEHDQVKGENNNLQEKLAVQIAQLRRVEKDNEALNSESQHLLSHSEDLEKALINTRTELIANTSSQISPHGNIIKEIENMKREKLSNHKKIRDLLDQLDDSENIISNLSEDISARDGKISILENHINELQDEVRRLHISLAEMVDTGEQLKDNSYQKIRQSLDTMEAHHSKATHNMKMELAMLQKDNINLEERLSITKLKGENSARDKHKYVSQIIHLQNEREIIVTDIKQLEMNSVGDSALSPHNCEVEDILSSLDRIRQYIDVKNSKSISLEQALLKVQNSYQIVQNKADEAKKIVENEKQKILNEKEEAISEKLNMEKQLANLKEQLEMQISHDKNVIKDLEAEILNQKLILDRCNNSTQSYISKLKEEIQSLQNLYQKALEDVNDLENKIQHMRDEKNTHSDILEKVNSKLENKKKEIDVIKKELEDLKNKPNQSVGSQVLLTKKRDQGTQNIEEILQYEGFEHDDAIKLKSLNENKDLNTKKEKYVSYEAKLTPKENNKQIINEVQILTANIEPTFDYVRNCYLNYKLKHLSPGRLEQHSISCNDDDTETNKYNESPITNQSIENMNFINIYNKESMHSNSSKVINSNYRENEKDSKSPGITSANTEFGLTIESFDTKSGHKDGNLFGSVSNVSLDNDLFVIYKDSETNKSNDKKVWSTNGRSEVLVKTVSVHPDKQKEVKVKNKSKQKRYEIQNDLYAEDEDLREDDSVKHKLKINLPRVETISPTVDTTSEGDKKSLDSYTMNMYSTTKSPYSSHLSSDHKIGKGYKTKSNNIRSSSLHSMSYDDIQYLASSFSIDDETLIHDANKITGIGKIDKNNLGYTPRTAQKQELVNENITPGSSSETRQTKIESHYGLSRIDADVSLIKIAEPAVPNSKIRNDGENFGLDYILATVKVDPNDIVKYNTANSLRKTRSDERFNIKKKDDLSTSIMSDVKKSSTDFKILSSDIQSSYNNPSKTFTERSIMVMLDPKEEYEKKIKHLTENVENIEKDYKKKIEAIKIQYDRHIKSILNEHNKGVKNIQGLHEETLQDIIKHHENEVENLRSMSIDAMRKAEKLEKEVRSLKCKMPVCSSTCLNEEPEKLSTTEMRKHRRARLDTKTLTKTNVEAYNVRPKSRPNGPCTCSLDINISDTIRNIFEQVDVEQRKMAEHSYLKYIANKILSSNVEALDCQELSFLHLKVCRIWKVKLTKEETLQKRIDSLEAELMTKQRHTQHNIAELDRKVVEERRRLQEVREAVCKNVTIATKYDTTDADAAYVPSVPCSTADATCLCSCSTGTCNLVSERQSAGDLVSVATGIRQKRVKTDANRAVLAKLDAGERREKKLYNDEPPTRLRRPHDRLPMRANKK